MQAIHQLFRSSLKVLFFAISKLYLNMKSYKFSFKFIKLVVKPFWISQLESDLIVEMNKEVLIDCNSDGSPKPKISFEKISKNGNNNERTKN
jgi:hypothetical protein